MRQQSTNRRGPQKGKSDYSLTTKQTWGLLMTDEEKKQYREYRRPKDKLRRHALLVTIPGRITFMLMDAKQRAQHEHVPFTLTREWLEPKIQHGYCERTGIAFDLSMSDGTRTNKYVPSLDRKVTALGYTPDNVTVTVWLYNHAKCNWTDQDLLTFASCLIQHQLNG